MKLIVRLLQDLLADLLEDSEFYKKPWTSYEEALERARYFKQYIENQDGYRLINKEGRRDSKPFSDETDVQLFFGLVWFGSAFDVNREPTMAVDQSTTP